MTVNYIVHGVLIDVTEDIIFINILKCTQTISEQYIYYLIKWKKCHSIFSVSIALEA